MSVVIQVRIHPVIKSEVEQLCQAMGMTISEAVRLFVNQIYLQKKIPMEIHIPREYFTISCNESGRPEYRPELLLEVAELLRDRKKCEDED